MLLEAIGTKEILSTLKIGDSIYKHLKKKELEDLKIFEKIYQEIIQLLDDKYIHIEVKRLFDNDEIKDMFLKMIFANDNINLSLINKYVSIDRIPPMLVPELYKHLKEAIKGTPLIKYIKASEQNMFLESIDNTLSELSSIIIRKINLNSFYDNYKENAIREYSRIKFFGIKLPTAGSRPTENKLESLYVVPSFSNFKDNQNIDLKELVLKDRIVILGKPGAGKSTFTKHLILNNLDKDESIPLQIELKDYDNFLQTNPNKNLLDFIIEDLNKRFHTLELTRDNVSDIFKKEFFSFYFDGLDEVFSETRRSNIRDDIENFASNYKDNQIIVTSRIVGYTDSPFDPNVFSTYKINDFDETRINDYVKKWFNVDVLDEIIRKEYFEKYEIEKESIGIDLLSNPLMLSIILILFTRGFSIPSSKLAIYQSCTETLVDKWEDQKEMKIDIQKKDQAIAHLAYWQYENIPNDEAVLSEMTRFYESFSDDFTYEEAAKSAYKFIEYLHKRSIYFNNIFVHKTFLEYYAARYIFTKYEKKGNIDKRNELINTHIRNSYWFVVLELLIAMIDKDQADNEVMEALIEEHTKSQEAELLAFFIKNFRNIKNVGKKFRQNFLRNSFEQCLIEAKNNYQDDISVSTCSPSIIDLHSSFDFLNLDDMEYIICLIPEYNLEYSFEVAAFFSELTNYKKLVDSKKLLNVFITSKMYAAALQFHTNNASSYTNWKTNFPIQMLDTYFSFVFSRTLVSSTISCMILDKLKNAFDEDPSANNRVLAAIKNSTMSFDEIPIPNNRTISTKRLIEMLKNSVDKEIQAFFLYLIYTNQSKTGNSYLTAFADVPGEYENILMEPLRMNIHVASSSFFLQQLNKDLVSG